MELEKKLEVLASLQIETEMKLQRFIETATGFAKNVDRTMKQVSNVLEIHEERISTLES